MTRAATKTKKPEAPALTREGVLMSDTLVAETPIIAFKGFDKNLQCRGHQFEVGKTYEHKGRVEVCASGWHSCENPLDVLSYYDLGSDNRFAVVRASGKIARHAADSKIASASLHIEAELKLPEFVKAAVGWLMQAAGSAGKTELVQAASGDSSQLAASGHSSQLAASGHYSQLAASGDSSQLAASGPSSQLAASGHYSVISASAPGCVAKGVAGTWIALPEFDNGKCIGFATGCIGQDGLLADTYYRARGGKLVAA